MNGQSNSGLHLQVAVALTAAQNPGEVLEAISSLLAGSNTKISYVFIEDPDLLRASQLPFAVEVCRTTNEVRRIDLHDVERDLQQRAADAKRFITEMHLGMSEKWTFSTVRQKASNAVIELAKATGPTILAATSLHREARVSDFSSKVRAVKGPQRSETIVAILDSSAASSRAVDIARQIATSRGKPLHAVAIAATPGETENLLRNWKETGALAQGNIKPLCGPLSSEILLNVRKLSPAIIVLPVTQMEQGAETFLEIGESTGASLLIVP